MAVELVIDPPGAAWRDLLKQANDSLGQQNALGRTVRQWREQTRSELGVHDRGPLIITGHHASYWHPGILSKYLAIATAASNCAATAVNLIVDQDEPEFGVVEYPRRDGSGQLNVGVWRVTEVRDGIVVARHPPIGTAPLPEPTRAALPCVQAGLQAIHNALRAHQAAENAPAQVGAAVHDLMQPWTGPLPMLMASQLMCTEFARALVSAMINDATRCVELHNMAASRVPEAGVVPLRLGKADVELPLWRIDGDGRRMRASTSDAAAWLDDPGGRPALLPRALLMTMLVRLGLCDLFVHGLGGALYDQVMENWCRAWLNIEPAPMAVVSATLRLPLAQGRTEGQTLTDALWAYRGGWHDPQSLLNHQRPSAMKRESLGQIDALPRRSAARRRAYFDLHEQLARQRQDDAQALLSLHNAIDAARLREQEQPIIERRTWAFPLYPAEAIEELVAAVKESLDPVRAVPR